MSKNRKPSLKDVSSFLKKQPHTLTDVKKPEEVPPLKKETGFTKDPELVKKVSELIHGSESKAGPVLIKSIIEVLESVKEPTPEEIMLLNTAYYLKYTSGQ